MFPIRDTRSLGKFPLVNILIILLNLYVFFLELVSPNLQFFINRYSLIPASIDFSRTETLVPFVTSIFLHAGFLHILSNMWFLWVFGSNIEAIMGRFKYLGFYLFCGIAANFSQYLFTQNSFLPMLGASGAIAGVLGAYYKFFPKNAIDTIIPVFGLPIIIPLPVRVMLIYWFITQAFNGVAAIFTITSSTGGVAYLAHIGGFIFGLVICSHFVWQKRLR